MNKGRLEAFSDGVLAIVVTIMILELHAPEGTSLDDLFALWPKFLAYAMSFGYVAIYWVNHHHLFQAAKTVSGWVLWSNILLLFTLSLVPFATAWMGEHSFAPVPVAIYNFVLILPALAYTLLVQALVRALGQSTTISEALQGDRKGPASLLLYILSVVVAIVAPIVAVLIDIGVAAMWIIPDRRLERRVNQTREEHGG